MNLTLIFSLRKILNLPGALDISAIGFIYFFVGQEAGHAVLLTVIGVVCLLRAWLKASLLINVFPVNKGKLSIELILVVLSIIYFLFFHSKETYFLAIICAYLILSVAGENLFFLRKKLSLK